MTIREIEARTGLERANIRFYEKEGFLAPLRRENGYREYSEEDARLLCRIRLLRQLDFSLEEIRAMREGSLAMDEALRLRLAALEQARQTLDSRERVCRQMQSDRVTFAALDAERYLEHLARPADAPPPPRMRPGVPPGDRTEPAYCPWRRILARLLDRALAHLALLCVLCLLFRCNISRLPVLVTLLQEWALWGILIPAEGFFLSRWGTTPGKWIMGIRVESEDGTLLSFRDAAGRAWQVFGRGFGWGLPVYSLVRGWKSFRELIESEPTDWDLDCAVDARPMRPARGIAWGAAALAVLCLGAWVTVLPSWPIHRGAQLTAAQFADNYNYLARYYGADSHAIQALTFTEEDGILTGVSFETESPAASLIYDPAMRDAAALSVLAFAWPRAGLWETPQQRRVLERLDSFDPVWREEVLGCTVTVTSHPPEDTPPGEIPLYRIVFSVASQP